MKLLAKAIKIAAVAYEDKLDKGGNPYILHPLNVMMAVQHLGEEAMCAAVLHDYVEDGKGTIADLRAEFPSSVLANIHTLTRTEEDTDEHYMRYIKRIACSNNVCISIKLADLKHNSDISRLKGMGAKDFERLERYCMAYTYLKNLV